MKTNNRLKVKKRIATRTQRNIGKSCVKVFRSNASTYVLVVDNVGKVLKTFDTRAEKGKKSEAALLVGKKAGEFILKNKIENIYFDRSGYKYHGRIKAVAEGLREAGVKL